MQNDTLTYAGFWARAAATMVDTILFMFISLPLLWMVYGEAYFTNPEIVFVYGTFDFLISYIVPIVVVLWFWTRMQATPGKMMISARIVDAVTGEPPSTSQLIIRYLGYIPSSIFLCLGLIWVAFDKRKQGWHDKMAGTVVVRNIAPQTVAFDR